MVQPAREPTTQSVGHECEALEVTSPTSPTDNELHGQGSHPPSNTSDGPGKNITIHNEFDTIVLPVLYLIIFVASILLNGLAVWIFFHIRNKTSFIFYLKNIVVADLIMTLTFPFRIVHDAGFGPWYFKFILCRYFSFILRKHVYFHRVSWADKH